MTSCVAISDVVLDNGTCRSNNHENQTRRQAISDSRRCYDEHASDLNHLQKITETSFAYHVLYFSWLKQRDRLSKTVWPAREKTSRRRETAAMIIIMIAHGKTVKTDARVCITGKSPPPLISFRGVYDL